jgi:hypothetical protein
VAADVRRERSVKDAVAFLVGFGLWLLVTIGIVGVFGKPLRAFNRALPKNSVLTIVVGANEIVIAFGWLALGLGFGEWVAQHFATAASWAAFLTVAGCVLWFNWTFVKILIEASRTPGSRLRPKRTLPTVEVHLLTVDSPSLRDLLSSLDPKARDDLRRVLILDQADRDTIPSRLMRHRDRNGQDWADIIDFLTMHPDAQPQVVRVLGELAATEKP